MVQVGGELANIGRMKKAVDPVAVAYVSVNEESVYDDQLTVVELAPQTTVNENQVYESGDTAAHNMAPPDAVTFM